MSDLVPRVPLRPLVWPDIVLELADLLAGRDSPVYVVGGAVRDAYLHRPVKDIDLAVADNAVGLARQIANALHGDFFVLDAERDVGRALVNAASGRIIVDVTRFRGGDLLADLADRDFTINAAAVDLRAPDQVIDPLNGLPDLEDRLLRRCSPHAIADDPIRALRAVRQSVQLGLRIEPETLADIRSAGPRLMATSPERVRDEFFKLLSLPNPASALRVADAVGLLPAILPEVVPLHGLELSAPHIFDGWRHTLAVVESLNQIAASISYSRTDDSAASFSLGMLVMQLDRYRRQLDAHLQTVWPNERSHRALLSLAALLHDSGSYGFTGHEAASAQIAARRADALRLSNHEKQRLVALIEHQSQPVFRSDTLTRRDIYRFWHSLDVVGVDVCLLTLADYLGTVGTELNQAVWLALVERVRLLLDAYLERYHEMVAPPPLLDGKQLMQALGLSPGPIVGELLDAIRENQAAGEVRTVEDALQFARLHLNGHN